MLKEAAKTGRRRSSLCHKPDITEQNYCRWDPAQEYLDSNLKKAGAEQELRITMLKIGGKSVDD